MLRNTNVHDLMARHRDQCPMSKWPSIGLSLYVFLEAYVSSGNSGHAGLVEFKSLISCLISKCGTFSVADF